MAEQSAAFTPLQFKSLCGCGALALAMVAANIGLSLNNRAAQAEVNQRQQFINETVQLARLNNQIVQALANRAVQTNDESIRRLLAAQGITITTEPATGGAEAADE